MCIRDSIRTNDNKSGKVLLLLHKALVHPSAEILNNINYDFKIMFLPANVTAIFQSIDHGVIEKHY